MARKRCCGKIEDIPCCPRFIADGSELEPVVLRLEELEAVRLKDLGNMDQAGCAEQMGLTRPTYQRILSAARAKIAAALVNGRTIIIEGGNYMVTNRKFECLDCGHNWEEPPCTEGGKHGYELACPQCGSMKKQKIADSGEKIACGHNHGAAAPGQHHHGHGCCCHK